MNLRGVLLRVSQSGLSLVEEEKLSLLVLLPSFRISLAYELGFDASGHIAETNKYSINHGKCGIAVKRVVVCKVYVCNEID